MFSVMKKFYNGEAKLEGQKSLQIARFKLSKNKVGKSTVLMANISS